MSEAINRNNILKYKEKAFFDNEFVVYYQPKYNQSTGVLVGAESLTRWNSKEMGFVNPNDFISIFEEDDTINRLDLHVLEKVCRFLSNCKANNYYIAPVSINLTRRDIFSDGFLKKLDAITRKYDIDFVGRLSSGVKNIEAVIPLTENKIPFKVRYTTEFDELGNPIKAFASATLI